MSAQNMIERIMLMKQLKDVMVIAHHYAPVEIHPIADVLADSRGFFEAIMGSIGAGTVMVIAPLFFAEIAAAILPDKKILTPVKSECPVAHHRHLGFDAVSEFKDSHPGVPLVCYATSPLKTKLLADYVAFPGEVVQTIDAIDVPEVLFVGEKNCAEDAVRKSQKKVTLFSKNPVCNVYDVANSSDVERLKSQYPDSCLMVHPECRSEVRELADYVVGTGVMQQLVKKEPNHRTYILGTELGFYQRMQQEFPEKTFLHLTPYLVCNVFKVFRIEMILAALETMQPIIHVDKVVSERVNVLFRRLSA